MRFVKMHGLGNDYVFVDADREKIADPPALARQISNRHTAIGSDGLVLFGRGKGADFFMRIYNADGSEAEMCGNATRCLGKYLYESGYTKKTEITLDTLAGIRVLFINVDGEGRVPSVTVDMGEPGLDARAMGMTETIGADHLIHLTAAGEEWELTPVSTGNPHVVAFVPDVSAVDLGRIGPAIERHPLFPARTNVEMVQVLSREHILLRVWERGSGETQACGTGACAAWVAACLRDQTGRQGKVSLPGGDLIISWSKNNHMYKEGPAAIVFEGEWLPQEV